MNADDDFESAIPSEDDWSEGHEVSGASGPWPQAAEARRQAGHPEQARRLAEVGLVDEPYEVAGRAVLALACLDLGDEAGAREALEALVEPLRGARAEPLEVAPEAEDEPFGVVSDPLEDLAENELDSAFSQAESEAVEVWTTNRVAEAALRSVEEGRPEGVGDLEAEGSPFATETVAGLLERQGASERAEAIRANLERAQAALGPEDPERARWIGTLEHWLDNLRRTSR